MGRVMRFSLSQEEIVRGDFDPFGARQGEFEWWMMIVMIVMIVNVGKMMVIV